MENKTLDILLIEDDENHLADAQAEIQRRINAGEKINVDIARDLKQYYILTKDKSYDGIVSDIFFPSDRDEPYDNLASSLVWSVMGRDYCERHRDRKSVV